MIINGLLSFIFISLLIIPCFSRDVCGDSFDVIIAVNDLNEIKSQNLLCTSYDRCYLTWEAGFVQDNSGLEVNSNFFGLQVLNFTQDLTPPKLILFSLIDLDSGKLELSFSEVIIPSSVSFSFLTLLSFPISATDTISLSEGTVLSKNSSTTLILEISTSDLNDIKKRRGFCTTLGNCYISINPSFIRDSNNNSVLPIDFVDSLPVQSLIPDTTLPDLLFWDIDLNTGIISLTFSETVQFRELVFSDITISPNPFPSQPNYTLTGGILLSTEDFPVLQFSLIINDLNNLKSIDQLLTSINNTYIFYSFDLTKDMNENPVAFSRPLQPFEIGPDLTPPLLSAFLELDMNKRIISLIFTEPVDIYNVNFSKIQLQENIHDGEKLVFSDGTFRYLSDDLRSIEFEIFSQDILELKLLSILGKTIESTFISFGEGAVSDLSNNYISYSTPLQVNSLVIDSIGPSLVSFILDLDREIIFLTFNDVVNSTTLDPTKITFQQSKIDLLQLDDANSYSLTGGFTNSSPGFFINFLISFQDINGLKSRPFLSNNVNDTYVSLTASTIDDVNDINVFAIPPIEAIQSTHVYLDISPPQLTSFTLNMNSGVILLTFSEVIQLGTLDITQFSLVPHPYSEYFFHVPLSGAIVFDMLYSRIFSIELSEIDLNQVKYSTTLATALSNTYSIITRSLISDVNENPVSQIFIEDPLIVSAFIPDTTSPNLVLFTLDMDKGTLYLRFDEIVNLSTFDFSKINISNLSGNLVYPISDGDYIIEDSIDILFNISKNDLDNIKKIVDLATNENDTYISISPSLIADMNGNLISYISLENPLKVDIFVPDLTQPSLDSFFTDLNNSMIILFFSETINATSVITSEISLFSMAENTFSNLSIQLTDTVTFPQGSSSSGLNDKFLEISLGSIDLNRIKQLPGLFTSLSNSFVSISSIAIQDMSNNSIIPIFLENALQASQFVEDLVAPTIIYFDLDLDADGFITLVFSETMNSTSLDITTISLQNSDNSSFVKLRTSIKSPENSHIIIISLSPADLNYIKFRTYLATHTFDTYLFLFTSELADMNYNVLVFRNYSIMVRDLILDTTPPFLQSYDLDLSNNSIVLSFSEVINSSSLDLSFFLLSSSQSLLIDSQYATLTGGYKSGPSLISGHPPIIFISLLLSDTNNLKKLDLLARDNTSTFLSISPGAAYDYFNNSLTPININSSLAVTNYIDDMVDPILVSFSLDLDSLVLTLYFSETIRVSSLIISIISLQTTKNIVNDSYSLFDTSLLVYINEPMVNLSLGYTDRNSIKLNQDLCTQQTNCFLSFNSSLIQDTNDNYIAQVPPTQAISILIFISDSTKPSLLNAILDLDSSTLSLYFDEPVDSTSLNLTQITIQSIPGNISNTSDYETFINGDFPIYSSSNSTNGLFINIFIGTTNLFSIQRNLQLATTSSNSYISFTSSLIQDMNQNPINFISPQNATQLSFIPDITEPMLQNFSLDLNIGYLTLSFDEVIIGDSLNPSLIILSSDIRYENSTTFVRLSQLSIIPLIYSTRISIVLSKEDLDSIKLSSTLSTKFSNTFLTLEDNCLVDTAIPANPNKGVSIRAQQLIQDITSPNLFSFNINLNLSLLILNFDEPVNSTSFSFTSFTFQNSLNITDGFSYISLSNGTVLSPDGIQITVQLNSGDVNSIKQLDSLFVNLNSSFISLTNLAFFDLSGNAANQIFNTSALKASMYLSDTVRPILMCYSLDMDTGLVLLTFDEIVNLSSIHFPSLSFQRLMDTNGDSSLSHSLSEMSYFNQTENDVYVSFIISEPDLNILKSRLIALSTLTTFLSINSLFISDMNYNYVFPLIDGENVLTPCSFLPDITPPSLFSFSLDLNSSYMILTFTETINVYTLRPSSFILASSRIHGVQFYFSTSTVIVNPINDIYATLGIAVLDSNEIKRLTSLAISINSSFLYHVENSFSDVFSNIALNRTQSEAIPVSALIILI